MSDPARFDDPAAAEALAGRDREARVEQLLLSGLDHYFAGRYEHAVHVWTRVLFLDRGHARARAYIERARSALAERQRHSEELLHRGTAAFERGQVETARSLLTAAVEQGAPPEVALGYLERLDRLESSATAADAPAPAARALPQESPGRRASLRAAAPWLAAGAVLASTALLYVRHADSLAGWPGEAQHAAPPASVARDPLPVPRPSDVAVARARRLFATGHARDAMRLLAGVPIADPNRAEAQRLLAEIQRAMLAAASPAAPARTTQVP